jgi:formylglycine-generating enzyme required for sulfatase activity
MRNPATCQRLTTCIALLSVLGIFELAHAQVVIESFDLNGELTASGLEPGTPATVEWASSSEGPWSEDWADLAAVAVDASGSIGVKVPMFYRVRGVPANPDPEQLAWIPPGTFTMGSPVTEAERQRGGQDETQHEVTISQGFWMGKYEVTQAEYLEVVGANPSYFRNGIQPITEPETGMAGMEGPVTEESRHPVETVTWYDANNYCDLITDRESTAGLLPEGYVYRLPTEAEWEYACRAGTTTSHHYGDQLLSGGANFWGAQEYDASVGTIDNPSGIYLGRTSPVGTYPPNAWGLHNMHGNVYEWCQDWHGNYQAGPVVDPVGPASGSQRAIRGGVWWNRGRGCRSASRNSAEASIKGELLGFRVVLARPLP